MVFPLADKTLGSVIAALDRTFRVLGGVPTYALTDNEKTVTDRHVARLPVRNPVIVSASVYYGISIRTCEPADPESKGGSEATVRIAKADLVPTAANLAGDYGSFGELEAACAAFTERINARSHAVTRRRPAEMLAQEAGLLHRVPDEAYTAAFGESRAVSWSSTIHFRGARYSVPHRLRDTRVWVRVAAEEVIIVADDGHGATEVARHRLVGAGHASICDEHYPTRRSDPLDKQPKATNPDEEAFLAIGQGAKAWLVEACAAGARGIGGVMADAVALTGTADPGRVDEALGLAATAGRFARGDLESILSASREEPRRADPSHLLQPGTSAWAALGGTDDPEEPQ